MTPDDMAALHADAFTGTRGWSSAEFESLLAQRGTFALGNSACFVVIRIVADEAEVLTLATAPDARRQGHARKFMQTALAQAAKHGAKTMFLEVAENNAAAIALYTGAGFVQAGRRAGYYTPKNAAPVAALIMRKALKTP